MKAIVAVFVSFLMTSFAHAAPAKVTGKVSWIAASSAGIVKIKGDGGIVVGTIDVGDDGKARGVLTVNTANFRTGNDLRDEHMHTKYLGTGLATLKLDPVKPSKDDFAWSGQLTIKDDTRPVRGKATLKGDDLWAEFDVSITDFPSIGVPEWQGVSVTKNVTITVKAKRS